MTDEDAKILAQRAITVLKDRKGFDWWWDDVLPADRRAIIADIAEAVQKPIRRRAQATT